MEENSNHCDGCGEEIPKGTNYYAVNITYFGSKHSPAYICLEFSATITLEEIANAVTIPNDQ